MISSGIISVRIISILLLLIDDNNNNNNEFVINNMNRTGGIINSSI